MGFSLNGLTLLALTLVIGILVDDAIVEIENIEKRSERGESPYRAALVGADSIGLAVIEFAIEAERAGASVRDSLMEACAQRTRPIVMTSVAMIAGMCR
jgi:multidrug efflux pump subunit AcrB